jgi:hypothetical protein
MDSFYFNNREPESKKIIRKNGRLLIYQRRDCGNHFYCRMKFRNVQGYIRKSLWTKIESEAIESAEKLYDELNFKASKGLSIRKYINKYLFTFHKKTIPILFTKNKIELSLIASKKVITR